MKDTSFVEKTRKKMAARFRRHTPTIGDAWYKCLHMKDTSFVLYQASIKSLNLQECSLHVHYYTGQFIIT